MFLIKTKKIILICATVLYIGFSVLCFVTGLNLPTDTNKEILIARCDEIAETFDTEMLEDNFSAEITVEETKVIVYVQDESGYGIKAKYNIVNKDIQGNEKNIEVDFNNAIYSEKVYGDRSYSKETENDIILGHVFYSLAGSFTIMCFVVLFGLIIYMGKVLFDVLF